MNREPGKASDAGLVPRPAVHRGASPLPPRIPATSPVSFGGMTLPTLPMGCPSPLRAWGEPQAAQEPRGEWDLCNHETPPRPNKRNEGRDQCLRGETLWNKQCLKNHTANAPKPMPPHHALPGARHCLVPCREGQWQCRLVFILVKLCAPSGGKTKPLRLHVAGQGGAWDTQIPLAIFF